MAAFDLEEQEQISQIKGWWDDNGRQLIALVAAVLLGVAGWQGWHWYTAKTATEASMLYSAVLKAGGDGDAQKAREAAGLILQQYDATSYAFLAALTSGKVQVEAKDLKTAALQLAWVVEHAPDAAVRDIARLRLAAVQFDQGDNGAALATLAAEPVSELAGGFADLRGDILAADGKREEAREAYRKALDALRAGGGRPALADLVEVKLDALGGAQ